MGCDSDGTSGEGAEDAGSFEAFTACARAAGQTSASSDPLVVRTSSGVVLKLLAHYTAAFEDTGVCPHDSFVWTACGALASLLTSAEIDFDEGWAEVTSLRVCVCALCDTWYVVLTVECACMCGVALRRDGDVTGNAHGKKQHKK